MARIPLCRCPRTLLSANRGTETSAWGITLQRSSLAVTKALPRPLQYSFPPIPLSKKRVYCGKEYCYTCGERALAPRGGDEHIHSMLRHHSSALRFFAFSGKTACRYLGTPHVLACLRPRETSFGAQEHRTSPRTTSALRKPPLNGKSLRHDRRDHASGTDRVFEAASKLGVEPHAVIVNIQGDEPALDPAVIEQLVRPFLDGTVQVSTLATPISPERAASPIR